MTQDAKASVRFVPPTPRRARPTRGIDRMYRPYHSNVIIALLHCGEPLAPVIAPCIRECHRGFAVRAWVAAFAGRVIATSGLLP